MAEVEPSPPPPQPEGTKLKLGVYPDPLVVPALKEHRQSFVILHGRGSNANKFGPPVLETHVGDTTQTLPEIFPHAKFIFPTAAPRRAKLYGRTPIFQWMDNWSLDKPLYKQELQVPGLQASTTYIHELLKKEIAVVGVENVVLGGLSQGCACSLISLLMWEGPRLPVAFGMCGWLPFAKMMTDAVEEVEGEYTETDDMFEQSEETHQTVSQRMVASLYETLDRDMPSSIPTFSTPIFLGHGTLDETVPFDCGKTAAETMAMINTQQVKWQEYDGLGHWYSSAMFGDIVSFIKGNASWS